MSGFTITITPDDQQGGPTTTVRVDTASGQARISELTVRAGDAGLTPDQLPAVNLAALVAALNPGTAPAINPAAARPAPAGAAPAPVDEEPPAEESAAAEVPAATAARARGAGRATRAAGTRTRAGTTTKAAAATKAGSTERSRRSSGRRAARSDAGAAEPARASRAYRRMPEPEDVVAAYRQAGSVGTVAEHFGVPRHTATSWLRRLRRLGLLEPASRPE